jgi:next-to-BRCA1 protein 1
MREITLLTYDPLLSQLRALLNIPPSCETVFERYSDSAAAFVTLDPANASVYKQLYRAAKAKLKLRLKVTVIEREPIIPKPATVEDEVPSPAEETPVSDRQVSPEPTLSPAFATTAANMNMDIASLGRDLAGLAIFTAPTASRTAVSTEAPMEKPLGESSNAVPSPAVVKSTPSASDEVPVTVTRDASARDKWFAEVTRLSTARQSAIRTQLEGPCPAMRSAFSVYCNNCKAVIPDEHYHCSTCDEGDYDLCPSCVDSGVLCAGESHWLIKRFLRNGSVITSTTETIAPKPAAAESKTTLVEPEEESEVATRTCNSCIQGQSIEIR